MTTSPGNPTASDQSTREAEQEFHPVQTADACDPADADTVICPCSGTTKGQVCALSDQGLDIDAISRRTGALSGCGGCEWDISALLAERGGQSVPPG